VIQRKLPKGRFPIGPFKKREKAKNIMQQILEKDK
jgi:hypothetical protein